MGRWMTSCNVLQGDDSRISRIWYELLMLVKSIVTRLLIFPTMAPVLSLASSCWGVGSGVMVDSLVADSASSSCADSTSVVEGVTEPGVPVPLSLSSVFFLSSLPFFSSRISSLSRIRTEWWKTSWVIRMSFSMLIRVCRHYLLVRYFRSRTVWDELTPT